ncbi:HIRAN domain-containing protein [uncultured Sphingomonas sp.]|uniref:HIRAN domain-containing protein n=1 Tax=uncultured Sphingomonas sp. TaxID=158754 RepID=UPI00258CAAF0|nr:HIRAN domain-containing protein [uncultured Sphingomonas sp.]
MQELTLAVVGIDFPNADGSNRRSEAMMTLPGESVELVPDPKNKHDSNAIAVISPRGIQLGYVNAERAPYIGSRMSRGEDAEAIFQGMDGGSAFIRVRFGGGAPTLPPPPRSPASAPPPPRTSRRSEPYDPQAFYPDEEGPEWGA